MTRIILLACLIFGCSNESKQKDDAQKHDLYQIVCKHPMGHIVKLTVTEREWKSPYGRAVFNFIDVNGVRHVYVNCTTNSNMRVRRY